MTYNDLFQVLTNRTYYYRVSAVNIIGDTTVYPAPAVGYPNKRISSASVNMRITTNTNNPNPQPFIFASSFNGLGGWAGAVGNVAAGAVAGAMPLAAVDANEVMIATIDHDRDWRVCFTGVRVRQFAGNGRDVLRQLPLQPE